MLSPICERAIRDAIQHGSALLKYISANDADPKQSNQSGYYLPKSAWEYYTPNPPTLGEIGKHDVRVTWQDGRETDSVVTWYPSKREYRLTRFGHDFPFRTPDDIGSLLVLIARAVQNDFLGYVISTDEDIEAIQSTLGVEVIGQWALYRHGQPPVETEDECVDRHFRIFAAAVSAFPTGSEFAGQTRAALVDCITQFMAKPSDERLMLLVDAEYALFRLVERRLCEPEICRVFESVEDFIETAHSLLNRRKARAGRSLENHVEQILRDANIPFAMRPEVDGTPDIIIPSRDAYLDPEFPSERLFVIGVKTTCKDRWRQVLREARRVATKHILTIQPGISTNQLREMNDAGVVLVVPKKLHRDYPSDRPIQLLDIEGFIQQVRARIA